MYFLVQSAVLVALVIPVRAYDIEYVDCLKPSSVKTYNSREMCPTTQTNEEIPEKSYTILQQPTTRKIKGFSCKVQHSRYHYKCGAWGHLKTASVPQILHPVDITIQQCQTMANTRTYHIPGNPKAFNLELNREIFLQLETAGSLVETNNRVSCTGETVHIGTTMHDNVLILEEFRFLIQDEEFLLANDEVEAMTDHIKLPCKYQARGCTTGQSTYTWSPYNQPCDLEIIKTIKPSRTMNTYLVDHENQILINTTGRITLPSCPMELTKTDHPTIFLANTAETISLPTVEPNEVDLALQSAIHLNYVAYQLEQEFNRQDQSTRKRICTERRLNDKMEPTELEDGNYGVRRGDIYYIFQCQTKTSKIREDPSCWEDIPIEGGNFVTPNTRQLILQSTRVPCSQNFPTVVKSLQGWIEILPHLKIRPTPLKNLPQGSLPIVHHDYSHGGLYSDQEMAEWKHQLSFPSYHHALLKSISYGAWVQEGLCPTAEDSDIQAYDLNHLIPTLQNELDLLGKFQNFLKVWGDFMAFTCLVIIGIKFVSDLVLISVTVFRAGPAAAAALIASLYLYNQSTYQRIMRKHNKKRNRDPEDQQERVPLHL